MTFGRSFRLDPTNLKPSIKQISLCLESYNVSHVQIIYKHMTNCRNDHRNDRVSFVSCLSHVDQDGVDSTTHKTVLSDNSFLNYFDKNFNRTSSPRKNFKSVLIFQNPPFYNIWSCSNTSYIRIQTGWFLVKELNRTVKI